MAFPTVFRKLYAEDGALYLVDTYKFKFFGEFLQPAAGYSTLIMRIGARFMRLLPLDYAPLLAATFAAICLAFLAAVVFEYSDNLVKKSGYRILLSGAMMFLPIASYAAVGNICNLYFFFMAAGAVLIYSEEIGRKRPFIKGITLSIAALSIPVCIFLLPLLVDRIYTDYVRSRKIVVKMSDWAWIVSMFAQFVFIVVTSLGEREPHSPQSPVKVFFLFLDRAVGSSLVPGWGFVSGSKAAPVFENSIFPHSLALRAMISGIVFIAVVALIWKTWSFGHSLLNHKRIVIFSLVVVYSAAIGLFFNPEPRYMVFPSFCFIWLTISTLSSITDRNSQRFVYLVGILLFLFSLRPSAQLSTGPNWETSLSDARTKCLVMADTAMVQIRTLPISTDWHVTLPCGKL